VSRTQLDRAKSRAFFSNRFAIPEADIAANVARYNNDYSQYGNEVYERITTRIAHWWNYEDHNWFASRIDLFLDQLLKIPRPLLLDIGFSVPYLVADRRFVGRNDVQAVLVDKCDNVIPFCDAIFELLPSERRARHHIVIADVDVEDDRDRICNTVADLAKQEKVQSIFVSATELIEHLENANHFWNLLSALSGWTEMEPCVYVSLPVGAKIPSHIISFASSADAVEYLQRHMQIDQCTVLEAPPAESTEYLRECVCAFGKRKA